ncbi:MAG TPA: hypothetical protein VGK73_12485 [Polyangiaceae bacterium]
MENSHRFKVGDRVVIVRTSSRPDLLGAVVTVTSELIPFNGTSLVVAPGTPVHAVDAKPDPGFRRVVFQPSWLEPYRPDHNERADLSAMPEWIRRLTKLPEKV